MLRAKSDFELVISDVRMPGQLSGIELAAAINEKYPTIKVLLTTGYMEDSPAIAEANILYKPYRAADLARKIKSLLEVKDQPVFRSEVGILSE